MTTRHGLLDRAGIILAGGLGTRLSPCTDVVSKQLLPVYDKPMIFYPLSKMIEAGIKDIMIIVRSQTNLELFRDLLDLNVPKGISICYMVQDDPVGGIAQAYMIADDWLDGRASMLLLGDNIFIDRLDNAPAPNFVNICKVANPCDYGVAAFGADRTLKYIIEKPIYPPSDWAVAGAYFFDHDAPKFAWELTRGSRGQHEIADLINLYISKKHVCYNRLRQAWFDCGTPDRLLEAANFIQAWQNRTGDQIGSLD